MGPAGHDVRPLAAPEAIGDAPGEGRRPQVDREWPRSAHPSTHWIRAEGQREFLDPLNHRRQPSAVLI